MKNLFKKFKNWNPSVYAVILLSLVPFLLLLAKGFSLDNDFWFLINTGKTILNDGFIHVEPFTIHQGLTFVPQQWLTDVVFYLIYNNFGIKGMFYLTVACNCLILFLSYKVAFLVSNNRRKSLIITIICNCYLMINGFLTTRPQMFDIIFFTLEIYLLELFIKKGKAKYLYFIPLISLVLINYHASMWPMIFVLMLPYYGEYLYLKIKKRETFKVNNLLIVTFISILVGFINPYGIEAMGYLFNSYGIKEIDLFITEMRSTTIDGLYGKMYFVIILIVLSSFYCNKDKNLCRYFLLSLGTIYLGLLHFKGVVYLIIVLPLVLSFNFKNNRTCYDVKVLFYEKIAYVSMIIAFLFLICFKMEMSTNEYLKDFADYLDNEADYDIILYTNYNDGGYMEYRGYKSYIDPRAEVFLKSNNKKEDIFQEYYNVCKGRMDVVEFINKYSFDYLLVDSDENELLRELQNNNHYEEVYKKITNASNEITHYLFRRIE